MVNVMVIGSGGREHALGWSLAQDPNVEEVLYVPGNAGTAGEEKGRNIAIDGLKEENFPDLFKIIQSENVYLTVVGPEGPLADGLVDYLNKNGDDRVFGPSKLASALETDKFFSYDIMNDVGIPQAQSIKCFNTEEAIKAIKQMTTDKGIVIKARGLTEGKGVTICDTMEQALKEIRGHAEKYGPEVLVAERLVGQEVSVFAPSDGNVVVPLEISVQDHKPLLDGDRGPNTGGMGAYCPAPIASVNMVKRVADTIMTPVVQEMKSRGMLYEGFMYAGMIMTEEGPKVLEFNIRMGDPEAQPAVMMLKDSLYKPLSYALGGNLNKVNIGFKLGASCCVVMASKGYPEDPKKGFEIGGLEEASELEGVKVFHAGTGLDDRGRIIATGGRVLGVTAYSAGLRGAQQLAYDAVNIIDKATTALNNKPVFYYRRDIGAKAFQQNMGK